MSILIGFPIVCGHLHVDGWGRSYRSFLHVGELNEWQITGCGCTQSVRLSRGHPLFASNSSLFGCMLGTFFDPPHGVGSHSQHMQVLRLFSVGCVRTILTSDVPWISVRDFLAASRP